MGKTARPSIISQLEYLERNKATVMNLAIVSPSLMDDVAMITAIQENLTTLDRFVKTAEQQFNSRSKPSNKRKHED